METIRLYNLIKNRVIIISQKCLQAELEYLSEYIIFCENKDLLSKAYEVLNNYEIYFENIYGNKTNKEIFKPINDKYIFFIEYIKKLK